MTFNFAPWAIDGARSTSALARLSSYATGGGRSGVVQPLDLKVSALAVPGNGLRISSGAAMILNGYQDIPDQAYTVSNPAEHVVPSDVMPSSQPATSYYLVCIVVGDPEFDQTGHPFMPPGPLDPLVAPDYEYVRIRVIPCSSGVRRFDQLNVQYPGVALARLEVPASTTTITNAMIMDVRSLAAARQSSELLVTQPNMGPTIVSTDFAYLGDWQPYVEMPSWATHVDIVTTISGISHIDPDVVGQIRTLIYGTSHLAGPAVYYEFADSDRVFSERASLMSTFSASLPQYAGESIRIDVQANRLEGTGQIYIFDGTTIVHDVRFSERLL